jgi:hypothetical protein
MKSLLGLAIFPGQDALDEPRKHPVRPEGLVNYFSRVRECRCKLESPSKEWTSEEIARHLHRNRRGAGLATVAPYPFVGGSVTLSTCSNGTS